MFDFVTPKGDPGEQGLLGEAGEKGEMGIPGIVGPPGEPGIMGVPVSVFNFKWAFCDYFLFNLAYFFFIFCFAIASKITIFKLVCLPFLCGSTFQGW